MNTIVKSYQKLLHTYPFVTQTIQTGVLMGAGDVIAQQVIERKTIGNHDYKRTFVFVGLGTCLVGPALVTWYRILSAVVKGTNKTVALKKVALDQTIFAPTYLGCFLCSLSLIEGNNFQQMKREVSKNYPDVLLANYKLWPFVQVVNFYFTPLHYQALVVQTVAISWNTYLSWKTQSSKTEPKKSNI